MLRKFNGTNFSHIKLFERTYIKCQDRPVLPPAQVFYLNGQRFLWCNIFISCDCFKEGYDVTHLSRRGGWNRSGFTAFTHKYWEIIMLSVLTS
jgi:hypothetical protein